MFAVEEHEWCATGAEAQGLALIVLDLFSILSAAQNIARFSSVETKLSGKTHDFLKRP